MAHDPQTLTIEAGAWGPDAEVWLEQATASATIADLKAQAEGGGQVFYIRHQGATVGAFLLRVDMTATGAEGVIVAAAAKLNGVDMIASCLPAIEAKFQGCQRIRYHTENPALARKLGAWGYRAQEIVCVKDV